MRGTDLRINVKRVALSALLASLYATIVQVGHPISFLVFQVRVANALIGLVPLLGKPAVVGLALGVFLANTTSPLGPIDLFSAVPSLLSMAVLYWMSRRMGDLGVVLGLALYTVVLSVWVSFMLWYVLKLNFMATSLYVLGGIFIATCLLGFLTYKALKGVLSVLGGVQD
jgi:hypothetical protein